MTRLTVTESRWLAVQQTGYPYQSAAIGGDMGFLNPQLQNVQNRAKRWRFVLSLSGALGFGLALTPQAQASFIGVYTPNNFTLLNTNADGFATSPDGGLSVVLTGGNNGSDLAGTTDFFIVASASGSVQFSWSYSACDQLNICDDPGFDFAGYLLNNTFNQLADSALAGSKNFTVNAGDTFGFRVGTVDNTGEPGVLTISGFSAPGSTSVPEPGTAALMAAAGTAAVAGYWLTKRANRGGERKA
jgi:hypothetical protein